MDHNVYTTLNIEFVFTSCNCRVLISAVSKKTTPPTLHFFNNCFDDEYSDGKCTNVLYCIYF